MNSRSVMMPHGSAGLERTIDRRRPLNEWGETGRGATPRCLPKEEADAASAAKPAVAACARPSNHVSSRARAACRCYTATALRHRTAAHSHPDEVVLWLLAPTRAPTRRVDVARVGQRMLDRIILQPIPSRP